ETVRNKTWEWFTDDFFTRFSEQAGFLMILTRWHIDDPAGRLQDKYPKIKVITYKAIAEDDEEHRKKGEALFPEHKSLEFLNE
ncbi:heat-shock protein Hsp70, partial [Aliarcobacter butzleri]